MPSPSPARSSPDRVRRERIAVVALSARSLAEAARRAGFDAVAIDLFGDQDLRGAAVETIVVDGTLADGPDLDAVVAALAEADRASPLGGVILGSGFETRPDAVAAIAARFPLLGASAESIRLVKSPTALARFCARSEIPHPEIATTRPTTDGWLAKTAGAAGGTHVAPVATPESRRQPPLPFSPQAGRRWPAGPDEGPPLSVVEYSPSSAPSGHLLPQGGEGDGDGDVPKGTVYYQRRVAGRVMSACALGTADGARVLAFCAQHTDPAADAPFRFGGVAGPTSVFPAVASEIARAADAIVAASGLRGLFGIDFILGPNDDWWLLEINPRPTAALDVLDRGEPALFALHLAACRGEPVPAWRPPTDAAATSLLYAPSDLAAVPVLPAGCSDRSAPGSPIPAGAPVCTLRSEAADAVSAASRVAALKAELHAALFRCDM